MGCIGSVARSGSKRERRLSGRNNNSLKEHRMTRVSIRRPSTALAAVAVVSSLSLGSAGPAQASPRPTAAVATQHVSAPARTAATSETILPRGNRNFPTWVFGTTRLCVTSTSLAPVTVRVQAGVPWAAPEYIKANTPCISRWWGGVPVNVMNLSWSSSVKVTAE